MLEKDKISYGTFVALICGIISLIISVLIIFAIIYHKPDIQLINSAGGSIKPNTSIAFIFCSVCLILFPFYLKSRLSRLISKISALVVLVFSLIALSEYIFQVSLIDQLFIQDYYSNLMHGPIGRPSVVTCLCFAIISIVLFIKTNLANFANGEDQYILLGPLTLALFVLLSYVFGSPYLLLNPVTSMGWPTALLFFIICNAAIFTQLDRGWARITVSKTASGNLLRTILIPNVVLFPLLGLLTLHGEKNHLYDSAFNITILVTSEVLIISVALIIQGKRLFKLESKLKLAANRLEKNNQQLSKINNDLDNFVYAASHDLKAPIGNIEALIIALFEEIPEGDKKNKDLLTIKSMLVDSVEKFRTTILDLTTIAKAQVGESSIETVMISEVVEEVKSNLGKLIEDNGPIFIEDFSKAPTIKFSKKNLRSILQNLISNGIKYRSPDRRPELVLSTEKRDDFFILVVKDNGLGIKEEDKSKVFAMYNRLHTHVEGTGIGMTIVSRIVDNNGGKIAIDSQVGKGSTFTVYLKEQTIEETL